MQTVQDPCSVGLHFPCHYETDFVVRSTFYVFLRDDTGPTFQESTVPWGGCHGDYTVGALQTGEALTYSHHTSSETDTNIWTTSQDKIPHQQITSLRITCTHIYTLIKPFLCISNKHLPCSYHVFIFYLLFDFLRIY